MTMPVDEEQYSDVPSGYKVLPSAAPPPPAKPLFDMSKAQPIKAPKPLFDMSKAQPIKQSPQSSDYWKITPPAKTAPAPSPTDSGYWKISPPAAPQPTYSDIPDGYKLLGSPAQATSGSQATPSVPPLPKPKIPGNIDLGNRPVVHNADGSPSTEYSINFGTDQGEVVAPTIVNGRFLTPDGKKPPEGSKAEQEMFERAKQHYRDTGQHMGIFDKPEDAEDYAKRVHDRGGMDMATVPGAVPGTPAPTQGPKPTVTMQPEALHPLTPEERASGKFAPAPGTELEHTGQLVPQAAVPALQAIQTHVNEPLNKMAQKGAEVGGEAAVGLLKLPLSAGGSHIAQPVRETQSPTAEGIARGIGEAAGSTIADPRNWPFLVSGSARPALQHIISLGFSGQMGKSAVDAAIDLHANWDKYTPAQRAEIATNAGISGLLAVGGAVHATHGRVEAPPAVADHAALRNEARAIVNEAGMEFPYNPTADDLKANFRQYQARAANAPEAQQAEMKAKANRLQEIIEQLTKATPSGPAAQLTEGEKPVHHASNDVEDLRASAERQAPKVGDAVAKATEGVPGAEVEAVRDS